MNNEKTMGAHGMRPQATHPYTPPERGPGETNEHRAMNNEKTIGAHGMRPLAA